MCTVWFVAFLLRQRGWAWVIIGIKARTAVRMAAPRRRRGVVPVRMAAPPQRRDVVPFSRSMRAVVSTADLPGLCVELEHLSSSRKPLLEPALQTVADAVRGLELLALGFFFSRVFSSAEFEFALPVRPPGVILARENQDTAPSRHTAAAGAKNAVTASRVGAKYKGCDSVLQEHSGSGAKETR